MLQRFHNYLLHLKGYSQRTADEYCKDLKGFARWMKSYKVDARWSTISRDDIDAYIIQRAESGIKASTTNRELASLSALFRWFQREGLLSENPCKYESRRKVTEKVPNTIPGEELRNAWAHSSGLARVWIGLLATTGIRISELLAMRWEDIDFTSNAIKIHGKGHKERIVYATAETLTELREMSARKVLSGRIFTHQQRDCRAIIWRALRPFSQAKQLSPHAIRHTFATNLATKGVNVTTIATILGHNRIETTQRYIDMAQADTRSVTAQYSLI